MFCANVGRRVNSDLAASSLSLVWVGSGLFHEPNRGAENDGEISFPLPPEALPAPILVATQRSWAGLSSVHPLRDNLRIRLGDNAAGTEIDDAGVELKGIAKHGTRETVTCGVNLDPVSSHPDADPNTTVYLDKDSSALLNPETIAASEI